MDGSRVPIDAEDCFARHADDSEQEIARGEVLNSEEVMHEAKRRRCVAGDDGDAIERGSTGTEAQVSVGGASKDDAAHAETQQGDPPPRPLGNSAPMESRAKCGAKRLDDEDDDERSKDVANVARAMCLLPSSTRPPASPQYSGESTSGAAPKSAVSQGTASASPEVQKSNKVAAKREDSLRTLVALGFHRDPFHDGKQMPQSRFKGCYYVLGGRWESKITYKSKTRHIGTFDSEIQAALAFDAKAHELGVPQRSNFLYDQEGNLIAEDPQGGARRARNRMVSRPPPVRARRPNDPMPMPPPASAHHPHHHHMHRGMGGYMPHAHYDIPHPPPAAWGYERARRVNHAAIIPHPMPRGDWPQHARMPEVPVRCDDYSRQPPSSKVHPIVANAGDEWMPADHSGARFHGPPSYPSNQSSRTFVI